MSAIELRGKLAKLEAEVNQVKMQAIGEAARIGEDVKTMQETIKGLQVEAKDYKRLGRQSSALARMINFICR